MGNKEGDVLKRAVKLSEYTAGEIAEKMGISRGQLYLLFNEYKIDDYYKNCLKKAKIDLDKFEHPLQLNEPEVPYGKKPKGVPVYSVDFTGGDIAQFSDEPQRIIGYIDLNGFRRCIGFVPVKGSSMYPDFVAGDLIGLEPIKDLSIIEYGQPFAIVTKAGQRMLKIIRRGKDNNNLILKSVNTGYDDIDLHKTNIDQLFKVHGPIRDTWQ